jgi:hypothetical protein
MVVSALIFGAIAVAVRSSSEDDGDEISGPAEQLPAVVTAAQQLLDTVPPESTIADELGRAYGEAVVGFDELAESGDDLAFADEFDRLPDAEARLLGRSLGEMQSQLSPTEVDGARGADDRSGDIRFGLQLSRAAIQAMDPDATARQQALAILPFSVQDLTGFDEIADMLAAGDLQALEARIDEALSEAGAAELVSSVANAISQRLPVVDDVDYSTEFFSGYEAGGG